MKASVVVLAGGFSQRFGQDKALVKLAGKPLLLHVLDNLPRNIIERIVVASSEAQKESFERTVQDRANIVVDKINVQSPLVGALTGFENVNNEYCLLLPCDTPFISTQVVSLLLELCINKNAVIPRSPEGYIEPLQAAYNAKSALKAAETALEKKGRNLQSMIEYLSNIRYISTIVIKQLDPKLITFFNINTPIDLKRAETMLKQV